MNFDPAEVKFLLLDLAEQVMPEVGEKLGGRAMRVLHRRGVDVRLGLTLNEVHPDHVVLSDNSQVDTHTVAWVTGVTAAPLIQKLGLPTEKGRLKVQTDFAVPGHPDVFAAGDAAAVPDVTQPGKITPPTAQHAIRQGKMLGDNVAASLGRGKKREYKHHDMGLVVDLGPHQAVANPLKIPAVRIPGQIRHPRVPLVCDTSWGQPMGCCAGVSHRRAVRPFDRIAGALDAKRCRVLDQRGYSTAENWLRRVTAS